MPRNGSNRGLTVRHRYRRHEPPRYEPRTLDEFFQIVEAGPYSEIRAYGSGDTSSASLLRQFLHPGRPNFLERLFALFSNKSAGMAPVVPVPVASTGINTDAHSPQEQEHDSDH